MILSRHIKYQSNLYIKHQRIYKTSNSVSKFLKYLKINLNIFVHTVKILI
jgi:hypothetical protein